MTQPTSACDLIKQKFTKLISSILMTYLKSHLVCDMWGYVYKSQNDHVWAVHPLPQTDQIVAKHIIIHTCAHDTNKSQCHLAQEIYKKHQPISSLPEKFSQTCLSLNGEETSTFSSNRPEFLTNVITCDNNLNTNRGLFVWSQERHTPTQYT